MAPVLEHLRRPRPRVLILPPGGFELRARAGYLDTACEVAAAAGFRPIEVHYPVYDPSGAFGHVQRVAAETGARLAYAESAGGALAGRLATLGALDRAALNAPVSNLLTWGLRRHSGRGLPPGWGVTPQGLRWLSPTFHPSPVPIDIVHSRGDQTVPFSDSVAWAERDPLVRLHVVDDPHIQGPAYEEKLRLCFHLLAGDDAAERPARNRRRGR